MDVMDADSLRAKVRQVVEEQERFCQDVQAAVAASRDTKRKIAQGKAVLPTFAIGDFVLYARVRRQGVTPKLMSAWTGPWRVVGADHSHVYSVQNIVSGVCRNRPCTALAISKNDECCTYTDRL